MGSPGQIKYLMLDEMSLFHNYSIMNPMPMPLIPLHFLLKNGDGYVDEALLFLLLQIIFDYVILVGSFLFILSASAILSSFLPPSADSCTTTILFGKIYLHSFF